MPLLTIETAHLSYDEATGLVSIRCLDDEIPLGLLESADDECPSALAAELEQIRTEIRESRDYASGCLATARAADRMRNSPGGW